MNPNSERTPVIVEYLGLQSGGGLVPSRALYNVIAGPKDLLHSTRTIESLEAEGYEVIERRPTANPSPRQPVAPPQAGRSLAGKYYLPTQPTTARTSRRLLRRYRNLKGGR